jgi:hypothetical protein
MDVRRSLATLARQIDIVRRRGDTDDARPDLTRAIFVSLRTTYLAISSGLDPAKDASHLFLVTLNPQGEPLLLQGGQPVPVNALHLTGLFSGAGLDLLSGQTLLLEPELAKEAVEEALGRLALEQALAERERCRRKEVLDDALTLPPQEDLDALRDAEERSNVLWDRKIELLAASLVADEYLERARSLSDPDDPEREMEAA